MLRAVVKLLARLVDRSSMPAAEQTAHPLSGPRRRRWDLLIPTVFSRAFGCEAEHHSSSPSIRLASAWTRLPETIQASSQTHRLRYPLCAGRGSRTLHGPYA